MGHNNTTLKNQNSLMKLRREIADGLHEGECQCPPSPQSVTDLHSEGRPSDRRHWARRCLNHFWRRKMCKVTCHILKNIHSLSQSSFCDPVVKKESKNWAHGAGWDHSNHFFHTELTTSSHQLPKLSDRCFKIFSLENEDLERSSKLPKSQS